MSTSNSIRHAVRYALLTGAAAAAAGPAFAADQTIQEVVVTGSRIAQPNLETTSPVTQVTAEDVITQGVTKIEDLVNQLPQAFAAQNASIANGATGTAMVGEGSSNCSDGLTCSTVAASTGPRVLMVTAAIGLVTCML